VTELSNAARGALEIETRPLMRTSASGESTLLLLDAVQVA